MHNKPFIQCLIFVSAMGTVITGSSYRAQNNKVIQIEVSAILNARSVTTLAKGNLVTWTTGIDKEDGYLTMAAARQVGDADPFALPDNPLLPASASHPGILLHYSNDSATQNQTRCLPDSGDFSFKVPRHKYADLYLSLTSSYGPSTLQIELGYGDGMENRNIILPDWYNDIPPNDPDLSYVVHNLGKWGNKNNLKEKDHHNIDALNIHPNPDRVLTRVLVRKSAGGYLLFWAATGVVKEWSGLPGLL